MCGESCRKTRHLHLVPSGKGVYGKEMCIVLIDLRPDSAPLPGTVLSPLPPRGERTLLLAEGLVRAGVSAATVCFAGGALARECGERGLPMETVREGISGFGLYLTLRRILSRRAPRIVHLFGTEALGQAAWLRRSGGFRLVQTLEDAPSVSARSHMKALRKVDAFVTPSGLLAEELTARASSGAVWLAPRGAGRGMGVPPLIRSVLPCALPVRKTVSPRPGELPFPLPHGHPALQGQKNGSSSHFLFFVMGEPGPGSGLPALFSAMARLRVLEESSPWEVRVAGELPDVAPLLSEAEDLRVGERLALLGAQDGDAVMGLCDAVISPMEDARGQADVLLAAWSRSLPVMASSLPRHEELDPDRSAFLRFAPSTPAELAEAMRELMRNRERRGELAAGGKKVVERLSPDMFCAAHKAIYEELGEIPASGGA